MVYTKKNIKVQNLEGEKEPFSSQKVYRSARNAGASKKLAKEITEKIEKKVYPNIKTAEIFEEIKKILRKKDFKTSLKFDLKKAMKRLGPTGFPFEKYVRSIFKSKGFKTKINLYIKGKCCTYEIDFLAKKEGTVHVGECKFRNLFDKAININFVLINYARFLDLKKGKYLKSFSDSTIKNLLITNAKFTKKAIRYAKCMGADLWGWKFPEKKGLEKVIEEKKLYPITILPSLSKEMTNIFISKEKMLAKDILNIKTYNSLKKLGISKKKLERLKKEAEILLSEK